MKRVNVRNGVIHSRTSKACTWLLNPAGRPWNLRKLPISNTCENTTSHEAITRTQRDKSRRKGNSHKCRINKHKIRLQTHIHYDESQCTVNRENWTLKQKWHVTIILRLLYITLYLRSQHMCQHSYHSVKFLYWQANSFFYNNIVLKCVYTVKINVL